MKNKSILEDFNKNYSLDENNEVLKMSVKKIKKQKQLLKKK